jgi:hypothetical protein
VKLISHTVKRSWVEGLRVFENEMLRKIFGSERKQVKG